MVPLLNPLARRFRAVARPLLLLPSVLVLLSLLGACDRTPPLVKEEQFVFGTRVELTVVGDEPDRLQAALAAIARELARLHATYHAWEPSALTRLNAAFAAGRAARVSQEMGIILREAQALAAASDHLFDPGIGALVALWGFHRNDFTGNEVPHPERIAELVAQKPSIAALTVTPLGEAASAPCDAPDAVDALMSGEAAAFCVVSAHRAVAVDLGGFLKGYALDRAAEIVRRHGIAAALINIGGNILALGQPNPSRPWRIALQHPRRPEPLALLPLYDGEAIGTSGDYQRYFTSDGVRYHHLIDPRTGYPATAHQAVTVVIPPRSDGRTGLLSDVVSKPLFIAGNHWPLYAARFGVTQLLLVDAAGSVTVTAPLAQRIRWVNRPDAVAVVAPPER
ncbi:FAD:protein FMN transferase [Hydrogenophilus islandicus]